jgi:hypothetical protein
MLSARSALFVKQFEVRARVKKMADVNDRNIALAVAPLQRETRTVPPRRPAESGFGASLARPSLMGRQLLSFHNASQTAIASST